MTIEGEISVQSHSGPIESLQRLESLVTSMGMTVFARIDHSAGAAAAGLELRPTTVLIFGNARRGTALMQSNQSIGLELPLKILIWQDAGGKTWLSYIDPAWLAKRYELPAAGKASASTLSAALASLTKSAAIAA